MIPGEYLLESGDIEANAGRKELTLLVRHTGDRPVQVGSHYHFYEVNNALVFDRERARGMHLNIAAGTGVRFEPGEEKEASLVAFGGKRRVFGHQGKINGDL
jgi:urease beta subunit